MAPDDEAEDDLGASGPFLPPDDRLWRHPSELRQHGTGGGTIPAQRAPSPHRPSTVWVALVAGLAGATLAAGVIAVTGTVDPRVVERRTIEKVALTPVVSSPMISGERGVAALAERVSPAIVRLDLPGSDARLASSGVLFRDDGLVLVSSFVVAPAGSIVVHLADGRQVSGLVVGTDRLTGVGLVDLDGEGYPVAVLGTAEGLKVGAPTVAIGHPDNSDGAPSVTTGVISGLDRRVQAPDGQQLHGMIQTDAPMAAGSEGSALLDDSGALIGIVTAVTDRAEGRFGFATPIDLVRRVVDQLLATGHVTPCWLGVEGADLDQQQATVLSLAGGAVVQRVAATSPAAAAGITASDVITEMDGAPIRSIADLVGELRVHMPGDKVVIGYWRAGHHSESEVTLVARP